MVTDMMNAWLAMVLTCMVTTTSAGISLSKGKCPKVASKADFDLKRYIGLWYVYESFAPPFQDGLSCLRTSYSIRDDGDIQILNTGVNSIEMFGEPLWGSDISVVGRATVANASRPAEWIVKMGKDGAFHKEPNYIIMATNYYSYSLVYSCTQPTIFDFKVEFAWILTRLPNERPDIGPFLKRQLRTYKVNVDHFKPMHYVDC